MVTIGLLKEHPETVERLAQIWLQVLGSIWVPDVSIEQVKQRYSDHLNDTTIPLTFVAYCNEQPVGMCSLRENDGIRPDLMPWLGSLVVDPNYHKNGIGKQLIDAAKQKAKDLGFETLFLFAYDPTIPNYYQKLGWVRVGVESFKGHQVTVMKISL